MLIIAFAGIALCFVFSNPPGVAPDETAHYLKAVAAGRGDLILDAAPPAGAGASPQMRWMKEQSGVVNVPARLDPMPFECWAHPEFVGRCDQEVPSGANRLLETYVASYPPFAYLLPGLAMRVARDPVTALLAGRLASLVISLALIGAAVLALYERRRPRYLLGLISAVSPVVLFTAGSLSNSGVEVAAAVCFFACLLRVVRNDAAGWVWVAAGISGAVLAIARDLGPAWVVLDLALIGLYGGWRRLRPSFEAAGKPPGIAAGLVAAGVATAVVWQAVNGVRPDLSRLEFPDISFDLANGFIRQTVGVFGALDVFMPNFAYRLWAVMVVLLVGAALLAGAPRQRAALAVALVVFAGVSVALEAVQNINGFGVQVRHVMPAFLTIPLLAGEIVASAPGPRWLSSPLVPTAFAAAASLVHLVAWHTVGRRYAVGPQGPVAFFNYDEWSPAGGWTVWGLLMCAACAALTLPFIAASGKDLSHQPQ